MGYRQFLKDIGKNIATLREERGFNPTQMARVLDASPHYYSSIERGERNPSIEYLTRIAAALEIDIEDIFYTKKICRVCDKRREIKKKSNLENRDVEIH